MDNFTPGFIVMYFIGTIITAVIFAIAFEVGKKGRMMKIQIELLAKIAEKVGTSEEEIYSVCPKAA